MWVRFLTNAAGPDGVHLAGTEGAVSQAFGADLVRRGYAVAIAPPFGPETLEPSGEDVSPPTGSGKERRTRRRPARSATEE